MKIQDIKAVGQTIICKEINNIDGTIFARILSINSKKFSDGDVIIFPEKTSNKLTISSNGIKEVFISVWENFVQGKYLGESDKKQAEEIVKDLQSVDMKISEGYKSKLGDIIKEKSEDKKKSKIFDFGDLLI